MSKAHKTKHKTNLEEQEPLSEQVNPHTLLEDFEEARIGSRVDIKAGADLETAAEGDVTFRYNNTGLDRVGSSRNSSGVGGFASRNGRHVD